MLCEALDCVHDEANRQRTNPPAGGLLPVCSGATLTIPFPLIVQDLLICVISCCSLFGSTRINWEGGSSYVEFPSLGEGQNFQAVAGSKKTLKVRAVKIDYETGTPLERWRPHTKRTQDLQSGRQSTTFPLWDQSANILGASGAVLSGHGLDSWEHHYNGYPQSGGYVLSSSRRSVSARRRIKQSSTC
jgi:hypothetical protein